jgi:hypothetical protein
MVGLGRMSKIDAVHECAAQILEKSPDAVQLGLLTSQWPSKKARIREDPGS